MAWCDALKMVVKDDISLKEYLHLLATRVKDPPCVDAYDEFLIKVWDFFSLRVAAEKFYDENRHVAISKRGPLPVSWDILRNTWRSGGPPEQIITLISKRDYNEVNAILANLRKVLNRVRQKVSIGRVQQLDAHCLRWLTRQPGRSAAEKGGVRQEILGVVRVENYNTLENRVLKDFLFRCLALATMYLRRYDTDEYCDHVNVKAVRRFKSLCIAGLEMPVFETIQDLRETSQPNYVLQQDRLYSKVWRSYGSIMRQEDVAEKLWGRRKEVDELYERCNSNIGLHCSPRARFDTPLWVYELDGRNPIFENPIWDNELASDEVVIPSVTESNYKLGDATVVDFSFQWDDRCELLYPSCHPNARPILQNKHKPSLEPGETISVHEIVRKQDPRLLGDYFRQLYGLMRGSRWVVLVPDHWGPNWLEQVIRAAVANALPRNKIFLLWRSVALVLGGIERHLVPTRGGAVIADGFTSTSYNVVSLRFMKKTARDRPLPQRASVRLHSDPMRCRGDLRFCLDRPISDRKTIFSLGDADSVRCCAGYLNSGNFVGQYPNVVYSPQDELMIEGVRRFLDEEAAGRISYYDERDALSLVVQNRAEEVKFEILVEHDECSPGGKMYTGPKRRGGSLLKGSRCFSVNLLEGPHEDNALLKTLDGEIENNAPDNQDMFFQAEMMPGQGLSNLVFTADFLDRPMPLDLTKLQEKGFTKARIEREMKRHFPPVMPFVEASEAIWSTISGVVSRYCLTGRVPNRNDLFAKAQPYWGAVDPNGQGTFRLFGFERYFDETTMSPIDKLKRENVFGNAPGKELPVSDFDWDALFHRLVSDWKRGKDVLRLIAWTYQANNPVFEPLRKLFHLQYVKRGESLGPVEITFCANNFPAGDPRLGEFVSMVLRRIASGLAGQNELRLLYNLLQFHPDSLKSIDSLLCEKAFLKVYHDYNAYDFYNRYGSWDGAAATRAAGYMLKVMLFLLHRRRFDPDFLKRSEDWKPNGFLGKSLPTHTPTLEGHEAMRKSFLNYVRGHGSIEGIPMGD